MGTDYKIVSPKLRVTYKTWKTWGRVLLDLAEEQTTEAECRAPPTIFADSPWFNDGPPMHWFKRAITMDDIRRVLGPAHAGLEDAYNPLKWDWAPAIAVVASVLADPEHYIVSDYNDRYMADKEPDYERERVRMKAGDATAHVREGWTQRDITS